MFKRRPRFKQTKDLRLAAKSLAPGRQRDELLRKARQNEAAAHMTEWLNSSGLKPPIQASSCAQRADRELPQESGTVPLECREGLVGV